LNETDGYELSLSNSGGIFFRFNQASGGNTYRIASLSPFIYPSDGSTWVHVAATYDGAGMRLYINGVENNSKPFSSSPQIKTNELELTIGSGSDGYMELKGAMDDVRIYNVALGADEIQDLATLPLPGVPEL